MQVIKRDGSVEHFSEDKIRKGLLKTSNRSTHTLEDKTIDVIVDYVKENIREEKVHTNNIYELVTNKLRELHPMALQEYLSFNKYRDRYSESFEEIVKFSDRIMFSGDKENANKDTQLNSTKQAVISEETMRQLMREFELNPEWIEAHDEGWVYIHDLGSKYLNGVNCCLFDMGSLLKGGFEVNGMVYREPDTVQTAINVVGDSILSASGNQFGGFTVPEIDTVLAPYAEKTYDRWVKEYTEDLDGDIEKAKELAHKRTMREIEKGYIGLETKINSISNSLGQTAFTTLSLGMDTSYWGRQIAKTILKVRQDGVDKDGTTSIFPKLVMLVRSDVNRDKDTPNHDIYRMAIDTSKKRLYPDYLSLDGENNNLADIYEKSGQIVSPMGCRAYLGEFYHPETGEMVITGRNNIGAVSINIPKIAIESGKDKDKFFELLDKYIDMVWSIHDDSWEKIAQSKGSTNPQ